MKRISTSFIATVIWILLASTTLLSCGSSRRTIGIEEGWEILAERKVNFVRDKDEIDIKTRNQYTAIRFKVENRDIRINELKIIFHNGDKLEPSIDETISAGQMSRLIELGREGRYIDQVEFRYRTVGNVLEGRANVIILGKRYYSGY